MGKKPDSIENFLFLFNEEFVRGRLIVFREKAKNAIFLILAGLIVLACGRTTYQPDFATLDAQINIALTQTFVAASNSAMETSIAATQAANPGYRPITTDECTNLQNSLTNNLGVTPTVLNPAPFTDYVNNVSGTSCQMTFTGDGNSNFFDGPNVFLSDGWTEAIAYSAGGASGIATAYQKLGALCLYSTESGPADPSFCAPDMFFPDCMASLTAEQKLYTVTVSCARYQP
jgi:hypothetical protein